MTLGVDAGDGAGGWKDKSLAASRSYVCKYSYDGGPCKDRASGEYPAGLHCPPSTCCSKTHMLSGQSGQWCTGSWALCNGALHYSGYSYGGCSCAVYAHQCAANASCKEEEKPLGGAYCECKEGYLGDGLKCIEDKCRSNPCYPGVCSLIQQQARCSCPENYERDTTQQPETCKPKDACSNNPCGDSKAVKRCYHEGPGRYSCQCNTGYTAVETSGRVICDDIFKYLVCSSNPCGVEGVAECIDTIKGASCTCLSGYNLVKETLQYRCVRQDPCLLNPCGGSEAVTSCVATSSSYVCTCKEGYTAVAEASGPYCAIDSSSNNLLLYGGVGCAALLLLLFVFFLANRSKQPELDEAEVEFLQQNPAAAAVGISDTAYFNPNEGWA